MFKYVFSFKDKSIVSFESNVDVDLHEIKVGNAVAFSNLWINTNEIKTITKQELD